MFNTLKEMFVNFGIVDNEKINLYYKYLKKSKLDEEIIIQRIEIMILTWKPNYGKKIPSISEIIGVDVDNMEQSEIENAWLFFNKTCCYNLKMEKLENWVYTIKKQIGIDEVENRTPENEKWIKKEFIRIYPLVKSGGIKLKKEPVIYKIEDGSVLAIPQKEDDGIELISKISMKLLNNIDTNKKESE